MKLFSRTLSYGYGFRDGEKYVFVTKGYRVLNFFTFLNVVRLQPDEAKRILEFLNAH